MKFLLLALALTFPFSSFAEEFKYVVLEHQVGMEVTRVKFKITPKMYSERLDPGIGFACYTSKNNRYWYQILFGDFFLVPRADRTSDGTKSQILTFKGLDGAFAYNSEEVEKPSGEKIKHMLSMDSAKKYNELQQQWPDETPLLETVQEVGLSKLSAPLTVNSFTCFKVQNDRIVDP